jgi:hypothetical protein
LRNPVRQCVQYALKNMLSYLLLMPSFQNWVFIITLKNITLYRFLHFLTFAYFSFILLAFSFCFLFWVILSLSHTNTLKALFCCSYHVMGVILHVKEWYINIPNTSTFDCSQLLPPVPKWFSKITIYYVFWIFRITCT